MKTIGRELCLLCKKREVVLCKEINNIEFDLVGKSEQEFQQIEVALTKECDARKRERR